MKPSIKMFVLLLALFLPALLLGLGERPVYKIQEVRIAETAREMLESGDWAVPRYNGELRLQKPPLPYWLTAATYRVAGVNEVATRLPAVLFGLLSALLVWHWVKRESGLKAAANCAMLLVASYLCLRYFRSGEADAVLLFFVSAACMQGYDILQGRHDARRRLLFGLALGLGFLTKGFAALAIPLVALLAMAVMETRAGRARPSVRHFFSPAGMAALLVAAFGWYVWIIWQFPDIAQHFFGRQVDETFVTGNHAKPAWWYLAHWFEFFAPWGVLSIPASWMAWKQRHDTMPSLVRFAWVWLAVTFVLLTATVNKQMQYALLFAPPLAIILGHYLAQAEGGFARLNRILFGIFLVAAVAGIVFALRKTADIFMTLIWLALPAVPLVLKRVMRDAATSTPVLLVAGITAMAYLYSEAYLSKDPRKVAAQAVMAEAAKHSPLYQNGKDGALSFYAGRVVPPVDATDMTRLLQYRAEIWLVGEDVPALPGVASQITMEIDDLKLYRLRRSP